MIVFFGNTLNKHQSNVADILDVLTGGEYRYVETVAPKASNKSEGKLIVERPYVIAAYKSKDEYVEAIRLAKEADIALFGADSFHFQVFRLNSENPGLSFEVSERWLKRGILNILSPRLFCRLWCYHAYKWKDKPLYKLCSSAYGAGDHDRLHMFRDRCYKWGYFTKVEDSYPKETTHSLSDVTTLMWCGRYLDWKHPEMVIHLARKLKDSGHRVQIDMFGSGERLASIVSLCKRLGVQDIVRMKGVVPNEDIHQAMRNHDIFLFTSDENEGWGAVLNEAMSNGCTVVASNTIGAVPFLINDGINGLVFQSRNLDSLYDKVVYLLTHPDVRISMAYEAYCTMRSIWSPQNAAKSLLTLCQSLSAGTDDSPILIGPCSKANPLRSGDY